MFLMHQWIKNEPVDLLIGNTYGKYIARDENIPLVRHGFPILDRVGHSYFPTVGYVGGNAAAGDDPRRPAGPQGPRVAGGELRVGDVRYSCACAIPQACASNANVQSDDPEIRL